MTDLSKVKPSHSARLAFIYVRQSSVSQVEHNRESTAPVCSGRSRATTRLAKRQRRYYRRRSRPSGATTNKRSGFARMISEVALGHVGMILGLEVSRLARNNADWYRLLELCGLTDTLIGDADGVYHPALFNDRLLLGLKGTMSEAELHIIRAPSRWRHPQQGRAWRTAPWLTAGFRLGGRRWGGPLPSRRGSRGRGPLGLRTICGIRFGAARLAMAARGGSVLPTAGWPRRPDSLGRAHLHGGPSYSDQSGVCWRLYVWQEPL
jgi:hypothetical protein